MKNRTLTIDGFRASTIAMICAVMSIALSAHADSKGDTLYDDLGGQDHIAIFTRDFVNIVSSDPRIRKYFDDANLPRLSVLLTQEFSFLAGGPVTYTGHTMKETHQGMGLHRADFNALVEDLQLAMDHANVPFFTQNRLLARLAPLEREIVTK